MTQDVDKFTSIYGEILPKFILAPFVIGYYSYQAFTKYTCIIFQSVAFQ